LFKDDKDGVTRQFDQGAVLGTVDYISPEQALNMSQADIRGDIYSLGCTFYYLLAGKPPFQGTVAQKLLSHQTQWPVLIRQLRNDVPPALEKVLGRMIAKKPEDRFQTPMEVIEALTPWRGNGIFPPSDTELAWPVERIRKLLPQTSSTTKRTLPTTSTFPVGNTPQQMVETVVMDKTGKARKKTGKFKKKQVSLPVPFWAMALGLVPILGLVTWLIWPGKKESTSVSTALAQKTAPGFTKSTSEEKKHFSDVPKASLPKVESIDARQYVGQEVVIRARIARSGSSNTLIFLNTEQEYTKPTNFTVVIPKMKVEQFKAVGIQVPESYEGKLLEVRGVVTIFQQSNSVQIRAEDPSQIEIIE
ncbi:MAG TPA: hypothetical protein PKA06_09380, partial [Gemmatales bacterium]|nr:hypothetical protein [Gemmatales bacterium]